MIKNPLGIGETPPFWQKKSNKKLSFFLIRKFWIGKDPPPFPKKNRQFLITEILDWVRPPPPFGKKIQKNFNHFLIRKFWIRRDPPPFRINSEKNQFFFWMPPLKNQIRTVRVIEMLDWSAPPLASFGRVMYGALWLSD